MPARVLNTGDNGDYMPMDHAPMPHGGGSTDDQCAHGKRRTVLLIGVQPHVQVGAFAPRKGKGRRATQISKDKTR
jgi:hypothetical protein